MDDLKLFIDQDLCYELIKNIVTTQSTRELGGCGVAAKPPHHTPHSSAVGLPE